MGNLKCIHCVEQYIRAIPAKSDLNLDDWVDGLFMPNWVLVNDAISMVPVWESKDVGGGQVVFGMVSIPVCLRHINLKPSTARSHLAVPGMMG